MEVCKKRSYGGLVKFAKESFDGPWVRNGIPPDSNSHEEWEKMSSAEEDPGKLEWWEDVAFKDSSFS